MWDLLTHILIGIVIGWYIMPFKDGGSFRARVNLMLSNLFKGMVSAMQKNVQTEKGTSKKATPKAPKQDNVQTVSGKVCSTCQSTVLMPLGGDLKGFGFCPQCQKMESAR